MWSPTGSWKAQGIGLDLLDESSTVAECFLCPGSIGVV